MAASLVKKMKSCNSIPGINKENKYLIAVLLIIFCIFQYGVQKICGFTLYPDEFGYWASAADAVGYNWSEIASLGSYYSFGYSLLLIPILKLFTSGIAAYRAAIAVNMALICVSTVLLLRIAQEFFPELNSVQRVFLSGIAALYPPWIFYMQMTMAEALLGFLFVLIVYLLLRFIKSPTAAASIILAAMFAYIYCVHMRTVGVVIAGVITVLLYGAADKTKRKQTVIFLVVLALAGCAALMLKNHTITNVFAYAESRTLSANDYRSQIGKLKQLWSLKEIVSLSKEVIGKIYYLGLASFGAFYWALFWCVKESGNLAKKIHKREAIPAKQWGALFLLLAVVGQVLVSSIYMHHPGTVDCLVYGRYNELLVPVLLLTGVTCMQRSRRLFRGILFTGLLSGGMTLLVLDEIERLGVKEIRGCHIAGISYLIKGESPDVIVFFRNTWVLGAGLMLLTGSFVWLSRKWQGSGWLLAGVMLMEVIAGIQISSHYTYRVNNVNFESRILADVIEENYRASDGIAYLDEGFPPYVDFLQMQFPDRPFHVIKTDIIENKEINSENVEEKAGRFLITDAETENDRELQSLYDKKIMTSSFYLYYNP